jgi:hypothetical protein
MSVGVTTDQKQTNNTIIAEENVDFMKFLFIKRGH